MNMIRQYVNTAEFFIVVMIMLQCNQYSQANAPLLF